MDGPHSAQAGLARLQVGLYTSDLDRAVAFYRLLLGAEPVRQEPDRARFELARPPLVLALYHNPQASGGALNHLGLRWPDSAGLVEVQRRLEEAGIATQRQEGVECCYARQTKFWVTDPDGVLWEVYTVHEDIEYSGFDDPPVTVAPVPQNVWEHRLTDPWPERIPSGDGALDEVRLEGSFNARVEEERRNALLAEAARALRPAGRITVRALVSDRPFPETPRLPGPASLVERIPVETEPLDALHRAGFGALFYEKLGEVHCFGVNGVELREMRLAGWKSAGSVWPSVVVVYKGPFEQVTDEDGTVYRRGEPVAAAWRQAERLRLGPAGGQFTYLES
jgi:catechol 2,3-dioxygenase-like lactoylglutathione lyase family enzyme